MLSFLFFISTMFFISAGDRQQVMIVRIGDPGASTIQEALDAIPSGRSGYTLIRLPAGEYREKVFWTKSNVALVGEGPERSKIRYPVLRSEWQKSNGGDDWGSGVINIGDGVQNVILGNLSVRNTYGDSTGTHDHQFTVRGFNATRISILYCDISSAGGDALSLWNRDSGMYYHTASRFEGWVDYVCPRGWCYVSNSQFFGYNVPSASIWHDGSTHEDQKFVIRTSTFDGVPGFPLGRHHRDAQFYLLDCLFSANMADKPLYAPASPNTVPWKWGTRHYYWNCSRPSGEYAWYADNLTEAKGSPQASDITPLWTFAGRWDPERELPSVLPFAALPLPRNGEYDVPVQISELKWTPAFGTTRERVVIKAGNGAADTLVVQTAGRVSVTLRPATSYTWGVLSSACSLATTSEPWSFTTSR